jgi:hypothetical protein
MCFCDNLSHLGVNSNKKTEEKNLGWKKEIDIFCVYAGARPLNRFKSNSAGDFINCGHFEVHRLKGSLFPTG